MKTHNFTDWLSLELKKRNWSNRELGRRANVSHNSVAKIVKGELEASWDFCQAISNALEYSVIEVLLIAGKLKTEDVIDVWSISSSETTERKEEFKKIDPLALQMAKEISTLPPQGRKAVFNTISSLLIEIRELTQMTSKAELLSQQT